RRLDWLHWHRCFRRRVADMKMVVPVRAHVLVDTLAGAELACLHGRAVRSAASVVPDLPAARIPTCGPVSIHNPPLRLDFLASRTPDLDWQLERSFGERRGALLPHERFERLRLVGDAECARAPLRHAVDFG